MWDAMVQFGLIRILHVVGSDAPNKDLLSALLMASKVALFKNQEKNENVSNRSIY